MKGTPPSVLRQEDFIAVQSRLSHTPTNHDVDHP